MIRMTALFDFTPIRSLFVPRMNWNFNYTSFRSLFVPGVNWDINYAQSASSRGMLSGMKCSRSMAVVC